jgi:phage terminase large subunit
VTDNKELSAAPTFELTERQHEHNRLLGDPKATHILAWGGSRSGKTFILVHAIMVRAMKAPGSRHLIARFRFNHVVQSVWHDTAQKGFEDVLP